MMNKSDYEQNEQMIIDDSFLVSNIYIDINFLKYFELGRFLASKTLYESIYNKVTSQIFNEKFVDRVSNELKYLFKDIPDIDSLLNHDLNDDELVLVSPSFDKAEKFIQHHLDINEVSKKRFNILRDTQIFIDISCLPRLSDNLKRIIELEYSNIFKTNVVVINNFKNELLNKCKYDAFFVSDLFYFNDAIINFLNSGDMLNKYVFCSKLLSISKMNKKDTDLFEAVFRNIEIIMTTATRFQFIQPFPCIKGD